MTVLSLAPEFVKMIEGLTPTKRSVDAERQLKLTLARSFLESTGVLNDLLRSKLKLQTGWVTLVRDAVYGLMPAASFIASRITDLAVAPSSGQENQLRIYPVGQPAKTASFELSRKHTTNTTNTTGEKKTRNAQTKRKAKRQARRRANKKSKGKRAHGQHNTTQ